MPTELGTVDWQTFGIWAQVLAIALGLPWIILQLLAIKKGQRLEAASALLAGARRLLGREIFAKFCDNDFVLPHGILSDDEKKNVNEGIYALSRIGLLLREGLLDEDSPTFYSHAAYSIRSWLVLDEYIKEEKRYRRDPSWQFPAQYFAVLSLYSYLKRGPEELVIYHPHAQKCGSKIYSREDLRQKLGEFGEGLVALGELSPRKLNKYLYK